MEPSEARLFPLFCFTFLPSGSVCVSHCLSPSPALRSFRYTAFIGFTEARPGWLGAQSSRRAAVFGDSQQLVLSTAAGSGTVF